MAGSGKGAYGILHPVGQAVAYVVEVHPHEHTGIAHLFPGLVVIQIGMELGEVFSYQADGLQGEVLAVQVCLFAEVAFHGVSHGIEAGFHGELLGHTVGEGCIHDGDSRREALASDAAFYLLLFV